MKLRILYLTLVAVSVPFLFFPPDSLPILLIIYFAYVILVTEQNQALMKERDALFMKGDIDNLKSYKEELEWLLKRIEKRNTITFIENNPHLHL
mgnify:CR=1 FL=1